MDTKDSLGNGVGGGEVLQYFGNNKNNYDSPFLNNPLIRQYDIVPIIIGIIIIILLVIMIRVIMNTYKVKSLRKGKGILRELDSGDTIRRRDASIIRRNKAIANITRIVESTPFKTNAANKEYVNYNLSRAGIKLPGGARVMKAEEFNAIIVGITGCVIAVSLLVTLLANYAIGAVMIVSAIVMAANMPMMFVRQTVKAKDDEIRENFSDFYLMIHYVLLAGAKTPLASIMKSYAKTTDSKEMQSMVGVCVHFIDTYGEYEATRYISKAYREIPVMGKLMRLIRQANEGGDVEAELMGFRKELLDEKRYAIERRMDKLIARARASFNLLMPILFQAVLSAMSIYLSDMGLIKTFVS